MMLLERHLKKPPQTSWNWSNEPAERFRHTPVLLAQVLEYLQPSPGKVIVDCTLGEGGHSAGIVGKVMPDGHLIGIDQDDDSIGAARGRLSFAGEHCSLFCRNFTALADVCRQAGYAQVDGVLFDLGISMRQLSSPERGFSFQREGPLNMRMDRQGQVTAFDLVNNLAEEELANLLYRFGQERHSRRIAARVVAERRRSPVTTTTQLADVVEQAVPAHERRRRIHPATKTFMALRIAVNRELEALEYALRQAIALLRPNGRICVISFHSLEDRIVKQEFRQSARQGLLAVLTKKPLVAHRDEQQANPASRSAKLRAAVRLAPDKDVL